MILFLKGVVSIKEVQLLWVYCSNMQPGTIVKNHSHDYFHLIDVTEGKMNFVLAEKEYVLEAGDMILVHKGVTHRFWNGFDQPVSFREIKFTVLSQSLTQMLIASDTQVIRDNFARQLVAHVAGEYMQNRNLKDEAAVAALKTLVLHLTAETRHMSQEEPGVIDTTGYSKLSKRVIAYLSEHYPENLSLDDISNGVGITKNYLCNAFKLNTGITIIECLNMIRVRKAAEQIVYSDLPLTQVAQMCGYVSASHFNRVFMRYVGMPPGQCRRAYAYDVAGEDTRSPGSFISSVLAGKPITQEIIREFENRKGSEE